MRRVKTFARVAAGDGGVAYAGLGVCGMAHWTIEIGESKCRQEGNNLQVV